MTRIAAALAGALLTGSLIFTGCLPSAPEGDEQKDSHYLDGRARVSSLDYKGAIQEFEKAIETNPRSSSAHLELALLYEEQLQDYAGAIYHYEKHLKLRPNSEYADRAKERIKSCKMDLVKTEVLGPVTVGMQRELERLVNENTLLKQRAVGLEAQLAQLSARPVPTPQVNVVHTPAPQTSRAQVAAVAPVVNQPTRTSQTAFTPQPGSRSTGNSPAPAPRQHVVKSGEKLTTIAARYGVTLDRLQRANPNVDARRLKVGQTLKIP